MARRMGKTADDQYMGGGSGNWSRAPKKKEPVAKKKAPNRTTADKVKKMKQESAAKPKIGAGAKPRVKPGMTNTAKAAKIQKTSGRAPAPASQRASLAIAKVNKNFKKRDTTQSANSVTKKRKPLKTGARSSRTSGTGYKEGSFMDRMTRAVRRNVYGKK